jgi:hypothetical protein
MTEFTEQEVTLGGKKYTVQRFRGLKAILVIAAITRIGRDVPDILADAAKGYYKRNTITVTEAMSYLPRWEGIPKSAFDEAETANGRREIEIPAPVSEREQLLAALPDLLESTGRREVLRLFAILICPNSELAEADKADKVNEKLDEYNDLFLYEAELDELAEVAMAARSAFGQLDSTKTERLGEMVRSLIRAFNPEMASQMGMTNPTPETPAVTDSTPSTSPDDAPISSTDSESPMDGAEKTPSMASPGAS